MPVRLLFLGAVLLTLAFAGCLGSGAVEEAPVAPASPGGAAAEATRFGWSSRNLTGDAHLAVTFVLAKQAACEVDLAGAGTARGDGPRFYGYLLTEDGGGMTAASTGPLAHAHAAGLLDSRKVLQSGGRWAGGGGFKGTLSAGRVVVGVSGLSFEAWDNALTQDALSLEFSCDAPFRVAGFAGSREVLLFSPSSMAGGVAVGAGMRGVAVADEASRAFASPAVRGMVMGGGAIVAEAELTHPDGSVTWSASPAGRSMDTVEGGPGTWTVTLDAYVGTGLGFFLGALLGEQPIGAPDDLVALKGP